MKQRKIPQRMCVGCKTMKAKRELVRVVRTPEGEVLVDLTGKKSGRGAYVCADESCLDQALKGDRLGRALEVKIEQPVADRLREEIKRVNTSAR